MKEAEIDFLGQLAESIEQAGAQLEITYRRKDYSNFDKTKKFIMNIQRKIVEVIK